MKLEGKIHDLNGPCCLKILIWKKPFVLQPKFPMKYGLKSMSKFNMDVKTLNSGAMDVKILKNGVNAVRGRGKKKEKKKFCCKIWDGKGWGCLGSKGGSRAGKSSCTHWWGIDQLCSILCAAQVLPPEYSVKAVEIKAWLLLRKRMTHNVNFFSLFFFFCGKKGWIQCFPFSLHPAAMLRCAAGQAGEQIMNLPKCGYWYSWDHYTWGSCELSHLKGHFSEGCGHDINSLIPPEISAGKVLSLGTFLFYFFF